MKICVNLTTQPHTTGTRGETTRWEELTRPSTCNNSHTNPLALINAIAGDRLDGRDNHTHTNVVLNPGNYHHHHSGSNSSSSSEKNQQLQDYDK